MTASPIADLRRDYKLASLDAADLAADPIEQFRSWFDQAQQAQLTEPNAMTLATVTADQKPSARIVLLKGFDEHGFCFYSNYESRKGRELAGNPHACLVFLWQELERQVRIEGTITRMTPDESDQYFHSRPINSRYGALVSPQSQEIRDREVLIEQEKIQRERWGDSPPRPAHWGGYRVKPERIEFWQGRRSRLHDRLMYSRAPSRESQNWSVVRLAP